MDNYLELELDYPYYKLYYKFNKEKILADISIIKPTIHTKIPYKLFKYKNRLEKFSNNKYFIIEDIYNDTRIINDLTDYFTEPIRVKCIFKNFMSPYDYWQKNKIDILNKTIKEYGYDEKNYTNNIPNIREIIFANTRLCNNMRITVIYTVLDYFKPKKYLDISAGWGDRLISAILYDKIDLYVSCDPNMDLHPYYNEIINTFVKNKNERQFIIHQTGFVEAPIEQSDFDIVFSSPPFFDLEIYSNYEDDSYKQFQNENEWVDNFLIKSVHKAYKKLRKDGHMILYIFGSEWMMKKLTKYLNQLMTYRGVIYFFEDKPRSMYVWQKV